MDWACCGHFCHWFEGLSPKDLRRSIRLLLGLIFPSALGAVMIAHEFASRIFLFSIATIALALSLDVAWRRSVAPPPQALVAVVPRTAPGAVPGIHAMPAGAVARMMSQRVVEVVLLDARSAQEFAVSHLPGAVHIDPDAGPDAIMSKVGKLAGGKTVVIYCTRFQRSRLMADTLLYRLEDAGARQVVTLKGGLLGWANDGRWMRDHRGVLTAAVHPFTQELARDVRRADTVRYQAKF